MGIKGHGPLEKRLWALAPRAFFYRLPTNTAFQTVIYDSSAVLRQKYGSTHTLTANAFVSGLEDPIATFLQATAGSGTQDAPSVDARLATHEFASDDPACPVIPSKKADRFEWFRENRELADAGAAYQVAGAADAIPQLYLLKDDGRYTPYTRTMLHEERYEKDERYPPFSHEEMRALQLRVDGEHDLPKVDVDAAGNPVSTTVLAKRAAATGLITRYWQAYGPYMLDRRLTRVGVRGGTVTVPDTGAGCRDVVLDGVPSAMNTPSTDDGAGWLLGDLPEDWTPGPPRMYRHRVGSRDALPVATDEEQPAAIGETDLKILYYIEKAAEDSDVLVRMADSDVLYILMQNAWRWFDAVRNRWRWRVFLDITGGGAGATTASERLAHRYVCINTLADAVGRYADAHWGGLRFPHQVLHVVAMLTGCDYITNYAGKGGKMLVDAFWDGGWERFRGVLRRLHDPTQPDLVVLEMDERRALGFVRYVFERTLRARIEKARGGARREYSWAAIAEYSRQLEKDPAKYLPSEHETVAKLRSCLWMLNYVNNGGLALGPFPTPHLHDAARDGLSVWSWQRVRRSETRGKGLARTCTVDQRALEQQRRQGQKRPRECEIHAAHERTHKRARKNNPFVCAAAPCVVDDDADHRHASFRRTSLFLLAEARLRRANPDLRFRLGKWDDPARCPPRPEEVDDHPNSPILCTMEELFDSMRGTNKKRS